MMKSDKASQDIHFISQVSRLLFKDSGGNIIEDGFGNPVKLNFLGTGYSISNFQANYVYNIMVSVQKVVETLNDQDRGSEDGRKVGDVDSNYETLVISSVPLKVVPKPMLTNICKGIMFSLNITH